MDGTDQAVVVAGATGDLGLRIVGALARRGTSARALVRPGTTPERAEPIRRAGGQPVPVDLDDAAALADVVQGACCVVSGLNGLEPVILGMQGRLAEAAVRAGVPRFVPSDFSLDFTRTRPGENRNMDLRRAFMARLDTLPVRATSVLNGGFADLLAGPAPIVLRRWGRVLHWGSADQPADFTAKDDVADYAADVALDPEAPRVLRIAGSSVSPRDLAAIMARLTGRRFTTLRAGGIGALDGLIGLARALTPRSEAVFPAWQGLQYLRDMQSGRGKLTPLDNGRYGKTAWVSAADVLAAAA